MSVEIVNKTAEVEWPIPTFDQVGQTETLRSGQSLDLQLKSWGRICVRSIATELREVEDQRKVKATQLSEALAELGVNTVAEAGVLMEKLRELATRQRDAQRDLTAALGDFEDIKRFETAVNAEDARLSNVETAIKFPAEKTATVTDLEARQEELRSAFREKERQVQVLTKASKELAGLLTECRKDRSAGAAQRSRLA